VKETAARASANDSSIGAALSLQAGGGRCQCGSVGGTCTCGAGSNPNGGMTITPPYVYALGRIDPRFPRLAVEKEFAHATGRAETAA
jgi:hypothetical protein